SDEEYDDLAMQDVMENGYWSDDVDYELRSKLVEELGAKLHGNKYHQNLDQFLRTRSEPVPLEMASQ
ncbi:2-phosphoglycerate kinase, partial [Trifolium medium]|nr:2-phosphoglycerate kinase [Trifolium medium]